MKGERVFDALEAQVATTSLMSTLALEGEKVADGLAGRSSSLEDLCRLARNPETDIAVRDAIWRELVRRAQTGSADWQLAAVWTMLPGLRAVARRIFRRTRIEITEIDSAVVAGFIEALHTIDPQRDNLGAVLWWKAHNDATRVCTAIQKETPVDDIELVANARHQEARPDSLRNAVGDGVLTGAEADLIERTRIEGERLGAVAAQMGIQYHACRQRRARAESRLAGYLLLDSAAESLELPTEHHRNRPCGRRLTQDAA